jgi:hypothetical protein
MARPPPTAASIALLLTGCASIVSQQYDVTISDDAATSTSENAPGLLLTEGYDRIAAVLCGGPVERIRYITSTNYACMGDLEGTTETRVAWIEPMPPTWDADVLCGMPEPEPTWRGVAPGPDVIGGAVWFGADLPDMPSPGAWTGEGDGTWGTQPLSSCSGGIDIEIEIRTTTVP